MGCRCGGALEIDLAHKVQQLLLPKGSPLCSWCCMGVKNRMALGLGGDYFDFIAMPDGCQAIFIGDVTGHGLHASVVMSLIYGFIHHSSMGPCSPLEMVRQVNRFLNSFADRSDELDHFFSSTLFCGVIDPETLRMQYVNAGHPAPLLRRGSELRTFPPCGPPVGYFTEPDIVEQTFQFERDDRFMLFTDGITETSDGDGRLFGQAPLRQLLLEHGGDHLEFLDALFQRLEAFSDGHPPDDDRTAIAIDFHSWQPAPPEAPA